MNAPSFSVDQFKSNAKSTTLAVAGIYVAAFDAASAASDSVVAKSKTAKADLSKKIEDLNASGSKLFNELVARGEKLEADAKSSLPELSLPKVELPEIKLPKSLSEVELPKFELPKAVAEIKLPEAVTDVVEKVKSKVPFGK